MMGKCTLKCMIQTNLNKVVVDDLVTVCLARNVKLFGGGQMTAE